MIDTVPLPERGAIVVDMGFSGTMSEFENVVEGLDALRSTMAIDTVPVSDKAPKVGHGLLQRPPKTPLAGRFMHI